MFKNACLKSHAIDPKSGPTLAKADREADGDRMIGASALGSQRSSESDSPPPGHAVAGSPRQDPETQIFDRRAGPSRRPFFATSREAPSRLLGGNPVAQA